MELREESFYLVTPEYKLYIYNMHNIYICINNVYKSIYIYIYTIFAKKL